MNLSPSLPGTPTVTRAVLLAAGRGTRMRELTAEVPKPMLSVHGRPILAHIVAGLRAAGVTDVLLVVGYRAEVVRGYFHDGRAAGVNVRYVLQETQDGTGRVVELARDFTGDQPFVLSYGDILIDAANYHALCRPAPEDEALVAVTRGEDVRKGGAVFVNERMELTDLREKPGPGEPTSPWYNAGVYLFRPSIYAHTAKLEKSPRGEYELTDAVRTLAQSGKRVRAYELRGKWADVRDPEVLADLERD